MKNSIIITLLALILISFSAIAQDTVTAQAAQAMQAPPQVAAQAATIQADTIPVIQNPFQDGIEVTDFLELEDGIYTLLLLLLSYVSFAIPAVQRIPEKLVRTVVIGGLLIIAFVIYRTSQGTMNVSELIELIINYLVTTNAYAKILKPVGLKTPQGATPKKAAA
jgi:hypothetical protein